MHGKSKGTNNEKKSKKEAIITKRNKSEKFYKVGCRLGK